MIEEPVNIDALNELASHEDPGDGIRWALGDRAALTGLAAQEIADFQLACLNLRDKGAKAVEVERLERAVSDRRRELKREEQKEAKAIAEAEAAEKRDDEVLADLERIMEQAGDEIHNLAGVLDDLVEYLTTYVWFPQGEAQVVAVVLWIAHTYLIDSAWSSPRLSIRGPSMRCGKTRLLEVLETVVLKPLAAVNLTPAVLFRLVGDKDSTRCVLLDEIDTIFGPNARGNEELRGLVDAGQRRGGKAYRLEGDTAKGFKAVEFEVFGPVALTGIGRLPATIEDRSIIIELARKRKTDRVKRFRATWAEKTAADLRLRLHAWARFHATELTDAEPALPEFLGDRAQDGWEPLLAIADAAGGRWPALARESSKVLSCRDDDIDDSAPMMVLASLRTIFLAQSDDIIPGPDLVAALNKIDDEPWCAWHRGTGLTPHDLAKLLRNFHIKSRPAKRAGKVLRGYLYADLEPLWNRYLDDVDLTDRGVEEPEECIHPGAVTDTPPGNCYRVTPGQDLFPDEGDFEEMPSDLRLQGNSYSGGSPQENGGVSSYGLWDLTDSEDGEWP